MPPEYAIVDLFAGPGGLAEGFSSIRNKDGSRPFQIALSVEKEPSAFETLRLRSFFRQFEGNPPAEYYQFLNGSIPEPEWKSLFPVEWDRACLEAVKLELGSRSAAEEIDARLAQIIKNHRGNVILIGGPPCQAYSLVGRARNKGTEGYQASKDPRHFLYKEYIRILQKLMPAAFVMENVKGLLSSSVDGELIFDQVLDDLSRVGNGLYKLVPLAPRSGQSFFDQVVHPPAFDFVVRTEDHGIPQSRHRVIIVGIRADIATGLDDSQIGAALLPQSEFPVTVRDVLMHLFEKVFTKQMNEDAIDLHDRSVVHPVQGTLPFNPTSYPTAKDLAAAVLAVLGTESVASRLHRPGVWAWLTFVLRDSLFPRNRSGIREFKEVHRWYPSDPNDWQKAQRHLVRMPVLLLFSLGRNADHLLASPPSVLPEIREQLTSQQDMFAPSFQAVARTLYFDEQQQRLKRGSGSKGAGSPRRLAIVRKQLDVTWDLYEVPSERLVWMLPKDFNRFRPSGERAV